VGWVLNECLCGSIGIDGFCLYVEIVLGEFKENLPEKSEQLEHVAFLDTGNAPHAIRERTLSFSSRLRMRSG